MKKYVLPLVMMFFFMTACTPRISYLGDSYSPTYDVDVFYDENDVEKDFRVIGLARNEGDEIERDDLQSIREEMIKKARSVGADGIIFISVAENKGGPDFDNNKIVEAKFIKYR
jgi:hypothetical protein